MESLKGRRDSNDGVTVVTTIVDEKKAKAAKSLSTTALEKIRRRKSSSSSNEDSKDLSITEIHVLDQYVCQMIDFTESALKGEDKSEFVSLIEEAKRKSKDEEQVRQSVKQIIDKFEGKTEKQKIVVEHPSEEQISSGVFTEVSFAGSFNPTRPPIPSPRTKRKARKEQMLIEHKKNAKEALNELKLLKKQQQSESGLQCLDELCCQSENIAREQNQVDLDLSMRICLFSHSSFPVSTCMN